MRTLLFLAVLGLAAFVGLRGWDALQPAEGGPADGRRVTLYVDPHDPLAWEAEAFFRSRGFAVDVRDVTQSAPAHAEYVRLGGGPLPLIRLPSEVLHGFERHRVERVLDRLDRQPPVR